MANPRVSYTPEQREALNALLDKANAGGGFIETWQEAKEKHAYQGSDKTWYQNAYRRKTEGQKKAKGETVGAAKPAKSAKSAKKRRGKRSRRGYDDAVKAAIVSAVLGARKAGESWRKAHGAAEEAGYKGTLGGLVQFIRQNVKGGAKKGKAAAKPAKAGKRGRGKGRPKGSATKAASTHGVGLEGVLAAYIDSRVKAQVAAQVEAQVHIAVQGALRGLLGSVK